MIRSLSKNYVTCTPHDSKTESRFVAAPQQHLSVCAMSPEVRPFGGTRQQASIEEDQVPTHRTAWIPQNKYDTLVSDLKGMGPVLHRGVTPSLSHLRPPLQASSNKLLAVF